MIDISDCTLGVNITIGFYDENTPLNLTIRNCAFSKLSRTVKIKLGIIKNDNFTLSKDNIIIDDERKTIEFLTIFFIGLLKDNGCKELALLFDGLMIAFGDELIISSPMLINTGSIEHVFNEINNKMQKLLILA